MAALLVLLARPAAAVPVASGTTILVRAHAEFIGAGHVARTRVYSNDARLVVAAVESFSLTGDARVRRAPSSESIIPVLLANTGNTASRYTLQLSSAGTGCTAPTLNLANLRVVLDVDADGVPGASPALSGSNSLRLEAGASANLLVLGTVPNASDGSACVRLSAVTELSSASATHVTDVLVGPGAVLTLTKTATYDGPIVPGASKVKFTIKGRNLGAREASSAGTAGPLGSTIKVNGVARPLMLLRDPLPAGTRYVSGSLVASHPGAIRLFRMPADPPFSYRTAEDASAVEVAVGMDRVPVNSDVAMSFFAMPEAASRIALVNIVNQAFAAYGDGGIDTEIRSNAVVLPLENNSIGISLHAGTAMPQFSQPGVPDGTAVVRLAARVRNYGASSLFNVQVRNLLEGSGAAQFGAWTDQAVPSSGQYTIVAGSLHLTAVRNSAVVAAINPSYTGRADSDTLLASGAMLPADAELTIEFDVRVHVAGRTATLYAQAQAAASRGPDEPARITDLSVAGADPDPLGNRDPQTQQSLTPVALPPMVSVSMVASVPRRVASRVFDTDYRIVITNTGAVTAPGLRVFDNLACVYVARSAGAVSGWEFISPPEVRNGILRIAPEYTGEAPCAEAPGGVNGLPMAQALSITDGQADLEPGQSEIIEFTVRATLAGTASRAVIENQVWAASYEQASAISQVSAVVQALLIDPQGIVYNSVTREAIPGALVKVSRLSCQGAAAGPITAADVYNGDSGDYVFGADGSVTMKTGADGGYQFFWRSPPVTGLCTYSIVAESPPGQTYYAPSTVIPAQTGVFSTCGPVVPQSTVPVDGEPTLHYHEAVSGLDGATSSACEVLHNNLPLDPTVGRVRLLLKKEANKKEAEFGDFVDYKLTLKNLSGVPIIGIKFADSLPRGLAYVAGTAVFNGARTADPAGGAGPALSFAYPAFEMAADATVSVQYRVRIGVGAPTEGEAINRAHASSYGVMSNEAQWRLRLGGGAFSDDAYAFGKVHLDCNRNAEQDGEDDVGIPGVRLFLENGSTVVTDAHGRWSLYGLTANTHVLRLDAESLPAGAVLAEGDNRNAGRADSRFLDVKKGEFAKANFRVTNCGDAGMRSEITARRDAALGTAGSDSTVSARLPVNELRTQGGTTGAASSGETGALAARALIDLPEAGGAGASSQNGAPAVRPADLRNRGGVDMLGPVPAPGVVDASDLVATLDPKPGFVDLTDGDTMPSRTVNVRVKGPAAAALRLRVNGVEVPERRVGKKTALESRGTAVWEYIGVDLLPGRNALTLTAVDPMGNPRGEVELGVIAPDKLGALHVDAPAAPRADPLRPVEIVVRVTDADGVPVTARTQVTLESGAGQFTGDDLAPDEPGHQVFIEGGAGRFSFRPPTHPGPVRLRASANLLVKEVFVDFLPSLRPMIGIGIVEGVLDLSRRGSVSLDRAGPASAFEAELTGLAAEGPDGRAAARTAFFFKGAIKGDYLLTTAYDSDKDTRDRLFRDIRPDEYYPVYGDSSAREFDAQSTQKLYLRVDRNRSYLLYGDFNTASSPEVRQLSQINRSLTGLAHQYQSDHVRVNTFASRTSSTQQVEEIPAAGVSFYFLAGSGDIVSGSEKIEVFVRSRSQPELVLTRRELTRDVDYTLETFTRRLLLTDPLASYDAALNPQSLRVSYEVDGGGPEHLVAGSDAQFKLGERVQAGVVAMKDGNPDSGNRTLQAVTGLARLGEHTVVAAEAVRTESDDKGRGRAHRLEIRHTDGDLKAQAQIQRTDSGFDNPSASSTAGRTEGTARAEYQIDETLRLRGEATYDRGESASDSPTTVQRSVAVAVQKKLGEHLVGEVGLRHGNQSTGSAGSFDYGAVSGSTTAAAETPVATPEASSSTGVTARLTARVPAIPQLEVFGEAEQDLEFRERRAVAVGGSYAINEKTRVYGRQDLTSSVDDADSPQTRRNTTIVGIDSAYMEGGRVYNELRVGASGKQDAVGLRNSFKLGEGLRMTAGVEHTHVFGEGAEASSPGSSGSATALTWGLDFTGNPWRANTAVEVRRSSDVTSGLVSAGVAYRLNHDLSLLARTIATSTDSGTAGRHVLARQQLGLAWRPAASDRLNGLLRIENRYESIGAGDSTAEGSVYSLYGSTAAALPGTYRTQIFTGLANFNPQAGSVLTARYAAKHTRLSDDIASSGYWAQLAHLRYTRDLAPNWDIGLQAGALWGRGGALQGTAGLEVGYQVIPGLWLSSGYNVIGLNDPDLAGVNYTRGGAYLRLRFKFDERHFGFGKAAAPAAAPAAPAAPTAPVADAYRPAAAPPRAARETPVANTAAASAVPDRAVPAPIALSPPAGMVEATALPPPRLPPPEQPLSDALVWPEQGLFKPHAPTEPTLEAHAWLRELGARLAKSDVKAVMLSVGHGEVPSDEARAMVWLGRASAMRRTLSPACGCTVDIAVDSQAVPQPGPEGRAVATAATGFTVFVQGGGSTATVVTQGPGRSAVQAPAPPASTQ